MNISDRYPYEGPRTPNPAEYGATMKLERSIFFKDNPSYMDAVKRWPMYLRRDLWENTFAMFYQGQPVSAICRLTRDIVFAGHVLRIGFVGGVCTHPDHRGKGLAGTVLDATLQRFMDTDPRAQTLPQGLNTVEALVFFCNPPDKNADLQAK